MRRDKDDASSLGFGGTIACHCFKERRVNSCRQISRRGPWELSEVGDETAEVFEGLGEQPAPFSDGELRKSQLEVAQANVAQAWQTGEKDTAPEHSNFPRNGIWHDHEQGQNGTNRDILE
jgi:hypothetical protein